VNWRRFFDFREVRDDPKPFLDHIEDLRLMLIKMLVVLTLMMGAAFAFQKTIVEIIERPLLAIYPNRTSLTNFGVADPLTIVIRRDGEEIQIDPARLLHGEDFPLQSGDTIQFYLPAR
jgi:sec-independent protein translocase protein TatC